jgi:hypothetical protein
MPMKFLFQFSKAEIISRMECEINQKLEPCLQICDEIIKGLEEDQKKVMFIVSNHVSTSRYGCVEDHFKISPKIYGKEMCNNMHG